MRPVELARQVGITRQALHSIETGAYVPNTLIALHLARVLLGRVAGRMCGDTETKGGPDGV